MGREARRRWAATRGARGSRRSTLLKIDDADVISDSGEEIWSILEQRGIDNVILMGVHTNMCVLGRPFGLRQMAKNGKNVVLMRDMTDTMYNPARSPYVSHFTGTDLIVEHVEKCVCPTITSDQVLGGKPFRFEGDKRPHVVIVMAEDEYQTEPHAARRSPRRTWARRSGSAWCIANEKNRNDLPGIDVLERRGPGRRSACAAASLPPAQLAIIRKFVAAGKPVVGIRTASHAFSLATGKVPAGLRGLEGLRPDVLGGNYTGHHGAGPKVDHRRRRRKRPAHPILTGVDLAELHGCGSLYKVRPLAKSTTPLLIGTIPDKPAEPIAWVNTPRRKAGVFYTSLGHLDDFKQPAFNRLLRNAVYWAAGLPVEKAAKGK